VTRDHWGFAEMAAPTDSRALLRPTARGWSTIRGFVRCQWRSRTRRRSSRSHALGTTKCGHHYLVVAEVGLRPHGEEFIELVHYQCMVTANPRVDDAMISVASCLGMMCSRLHFVITQRAQVVKRVAEGTEAMRTTRRSLSATA